MQVRRTRWHAPILFVAFFRHGPDYAGWNDSIAISDPVLSEPELWPPEFSQERLNEFVNVARPQCSARSSRSRRHRNGSKGAGVSSPR